MIGERLAELRKDNGLKQAELAKTLKISIHTLSNYETNKSTPDDETKVKIARHFNVSLDYLLGVIDVQRPLDTSSTVFISKDSFPHEAINEIKEFICFIKLKYKI